MASAWARPGGVAPSYALIADYFPPAKRARALAIYSLGIPIGLAMGALLGGYIAQNVDWRMAFVVIGLAGVVIAPLFRLYRARSAAPGGNRIGAAGAGQPRCSRSSAKKPSFWLMAFGAAMSSLCGYGLAFWVPSVLIRSFGFDLVGVGQFAGSLLLIGGTVGGVRRRLAGGPDGRARPRHYAKLPAYAWLLTAPLFAAGLLSTSPVLAWLLLLAPHGLNILWLGPITTAVQHLVPPHMRATASASFLLINNLVGLGLGTLVMGALSDAMTRGLR